MIQFNRKCFIILISVMWILPATAQKIFREGYIVRNDGKMLTGLVQFNTKQEIQENCIFRRFEISEQVVLTKNDIKEFGYLNGNRFILKKYQGRESFFELLVMGKLSLFKSKDGYYLEKGETGLIKLGDVDISYYIDGIKYSAEGAVKLIENLTEGKVNPVEKQTITNEEQLIGKIAEYNKISSVPFFITNREFDASKKIAQALVTGSNRNRYGILIGTDIFMSFSPGENLSATSPIDFQTWGAGVYFERIVSKLNDRLTFGGELLLINQKFSQFYLGKNGYGPIRNFEYFNSKEIKPAIYLKYTFSGRKIEPFLSPGISCRTIVSNDFFQLIQTENKGIVTTVRNSDKTFRPVSPNLLISCGLNYKISNKVKINLNARAEIGLEGIFTNETNEQYKFYNIGIMTGIQF